MTQQTNNATITTSEQARTYSYDLRARMNKVTKSSSRSTLLLAAADHLLASDMLLASSTRNWKKGFKAVARMMKQDAAWHKAQAQKLTKQAA